ncbi:MAG: hypothetical protein WBP31_01375 [Chitinophagales bacterium]|jgi:hypothetical protein|nr:hypothetical protein [Bacteroidota bacterium]MBL0281852.1 hypothetical protein [Bacteroidota bacterium]
MAFMHRFDYKQVLGLLIIVLLSSAAINRKNKAASNAPSEDVKKMDAMLLSDLKQQEITIDEHTQCLMECASIKETELRALFDIDNVNYSKCDAGNCHLTSYTIEGKLDNGKAVSFKLDSGEEGNQLRALNITEADCNCS